MEYGEKVFYLIGTDKQDALDNSAVYESRRDAGIVREGKHIYKVYVTLTKSALYGPTE